MNHQSTKAKVEENHFQKQKQSLGVKEYNRQYEDKKSAWLRKKENWVLLQGPSTSLREKLSRKRVCFKCCKENHVLKDFPRADKSDQEPVVVGKMYLMSRIHDFTGDATHLKYSPIL
ncbi:unnamed protein product [Amaranthus hypochondriacus]